MKKDVFMNMNLIEKKKKTSNNADGFHTDKGIIFVVTSIEERGLTSAVATIVPMTYSSEGLVLMISYPNRNSCILK